MSGSDPMKYVMHSSVKEFKDSYMGLYPVEENWFSDSIRTYHDNGRYLRYIKDEDARQFAAYAHKLEQYNVQIHKWYAEQIGIQEDVFIKKNRTLPGSDPMKSQFVTNQICSHVTDLLSFVSLAFLCNPADFLPDYLFHLQCYI